MFSFNAFFKESCQKFSLNKTVIALHDVIKKSKRTYRSAKTFKLELHQS